MQHASVETNSHEVSMRGAPSTDETGNVSVWDGTRAQLLERAAQSLGAVASGSFDAQSPPWATVSNVHSALSVLASSTATEPAPGLKLLAEELVSLCVRLRAGQETAVRLAFSILVGGILELLRRSNPSLDHATDSLLRTVAIMDELRALRGAPLLSDSPIFVPPDPKWLASLSAAGNDNLGKPIAAKMLAQVRSHFEHGIKGWVRDHSSSDALAAALKSLDFLSRYSPTPLHRGQWLFAAAFVEALAASRRQPSPAVRWVLSALARAIGPVHAGADGAAPVALVVASGPVLSTAVLKALNVQLARARAPHGERGQQARAVLRPGAAFVRPSHAGTLRAGQRQNFELHRQALHDSISKVAEGAALPAGLGARFSRYCDGLALNGQFAERVVLLRNWPTAERPLVHENSEYMALEPDIDWPWLALTLRSLESAEPKASDPNAQARTLLSARQRDAAARELTRASETLQRMEQGQPSSEFAPARGIATEVVATPDMTAIEGAVAAPPVGSPFVQPDPGATATRPRGAIREPVDELPDQDGTVAARELPGIAVLAQRARALSDSDSPTSDRSARVAQGAQVAPGAHAASSAPAAVPVDAELLENLNWVARSIGTSRSQTERHVGSLRDGAMDLDRTLRSINDDLRRLRSDAELNSDDGLEDGAPAQTDSHTAATSLSPERLQSLRTRIERMSQNMSNLARIQGSFESITSEARQQLRREARATDSLQAGLARSGATNLGAVWDQVAAPIRSRSVARGVELVLALTGSGIVIARSSVVLIQRSLQDVLEAVAAAIERTSQAASAAVPLAVVDVQARESGPCLEVELSVRQGGVALEFDAQLADALDRLNASAAGGWCEMSSGELLRCRWPLGPRLMKLVKLSLEGFGDVTIPAEAVVEAAPAQQAEDTAAEGIWRAGECYSLLSPAALFWVGVGTSAAGGVSAETPIGLDSSAPTILGGDNFSGKAVLLVCSEGKRFAVPTYSVEEPSVVSVEPLPAILISLAQVLGAAVLADEQVVPVLNPAFWSQ